MVATALMGILGATAQAQNLVPNASFDSGSSDWTIVLPAMSVISNNVGSASPPSMYVAVDGGSSTAQVYTASCIPVNALQAYDLIVNTWLTSGAADASVSAYSTAACGGFLGVGGSVAAGSGVGIGGNWHRSEMTNFTLPAGTNGVRTTLTATGASAAAYFDDVRFGPTGSTPVTLQSFRVD